MTDLVRFGVSIDKELHDKFDKKIKKQGYKNRSEAIRDLIRNSFIEEEWNTDDIVVGGISIIYDHHRRMLLNKVMDLQHDNHDLIVSTQHIHLSHSDCLEILLFKGNANRIKNLYNALKAIKGVGHVNIMKSGIFSNIGK